MSDCARHGPRVEKAKPVLLPVPDDSYERFIKQQLKMLQDEPLGFCSQRRSQER